MTATSPPPADRPVPRAADRPRLGPTRPEAAAAGLLAAALLISAGLRARVGDDPTPGRPVACRLDPNAATPAEWALLRGVGPVLAGRITDDRASRGPFRGPPDLLAVKGVGPKTLARLTPHLRFPAPAAAPSAADPAVLTVAR